MLVQLASDNPAGALARAQDSPGADPWNVAALLLANHQDAQALAQIRRLEPGLLEQPPRTRTAWAFDRGLAGLALLRTGAAAQGRALLGDMLKVNANRVYGAGLLDRSWWDAIAFSWLGQPQQACAALHDAVAHGYFLGLDRLDHDPLIADLRALSCYEPMLRPARNRAAAQIEAARKAGLLAQQQ
jgi:hypothetical protein